MEKRFPEHYKRALGQPIRLWPQGEAPLFDEALGQDEPMLFPYLLKDKPQAGVVIVCAGGGYTNRAYHEGELVAEKLNSLGFHAVVLSYRVAPYKYPAMHLDLKRAIRTMRHLGQSLGVNQEKIAVMGFSAGGHLAASCATVFDHGDPGSNDPVERVSSRPDAAVISYGVISLMANPHQGSRINLLGENPDEELLKLLSAELNVTAQTPPFFLWHTAQDKGVHPFNSLNMAAALINEGVTCALHIYPYGGHGIGLGVEREGVHPENFQAVHWPEEAARFLKEEGF
ncbi:MAG: alpha/beta hydrolase [Christensenellales bacterium]|jgi:acetyl esterase/lipase